MVSCKRSTSEYSPGSHPPLLELFLLLQQNPEIKGVSAYTIGSVKRHLHLIDDEFRQNPRNHRLFLNILAWRRKA